MSSSSSSVEVATPAVPQSRVTFTYKNYRGETSVRLVIPKRFFWGRTEWHPETQWLLDAYDVNKEELRTFAMKDIKDWEPC